MQEEELLIQMTDEVDYDVEGKITIWMREIQIYAYREDKP